MPRIRLRGMGGSGIDQYIILNPFSTFCDSNRARNQAIFDRLFGPFTKKQYEKATEPADHLIRNLVCAIDKRHFTLSILKKLANELDGLMEDVDVSKATGSSRAVSREAVAGSAVENRMSKLTFRDSSEATSKAGEAISGKAELAKAMFMSMGKMKKAQEALEDDKKVLMRLDDFYAGLERTANDISQSSPHFKSAETILCSILMASKTTHSATGRQMLLADLIATILAETSAKRSGKIAERIREKVTSGLVPKLTFVFSKGALKTAENVVAQIVKREREGGEELSLTRAFTMYKALDLKKFLSKGSKSAAAEFLRQVAEGLREQHEAMEQLQSEITKYDKN